jgi:hypothetical protein
VISVAILAAVRSPLRRVYARSAKRRHRIEADFDHPQDVRMAALQRTPRPVLRDADVVPGVKRPSAPPPHFPGEQVSPEACEAAESIAFIAYPAFSEIASQGDRL